MYGKKKRGELMNFKKIGKPYDLKVSWNFKLINRVYVISVRESAIQWSSRSTHTGMTRAEWYIWKGIIVQPPQEGTRLNLYPGTKVVPISCKHPLNLHLILFFWRRYFIHFGTFPCRPLKITTWNDPNETHEGIFYFPHLSMKAVITNSASG